MDFKVVKNLLCKYEDYCDASLSEDIWKPIPSEKAWIPARKGCEKFEWS